MRISDWSSDVCSSDLQVEEGATQSLFQAPAHPYTQGLLGASLHGGKTLHYSEARLPELRTDQDANNGHNTFTLHTPALPDQILRPKQNLLGKSTEEHTSELQSLMTISYPVFCLNNNTTNLCILLHAH